MAGHRVVSAQQIGVGSKAGEMIFHAAQAETRVGHHLVEMRHQLVLRHRGNGAEIGLIEAGDIQRPEPPAMPGRALASQLEQAAQPPLSVPPELLP